MNALRVKQDGDLLRVTMARPELRQVTVSWRASPSSLVTLAESRSRWPATSFVTRGVIAIRAAGPGTIFTSVRLMYGREPVTSATTATGIVPVEPAVTRPVLSTLPSNRPPAARNNTRTLAMGWPAESRASARNRSVSPGVRTPRAGVSTTSATGEAGSAAAGGGVGCCMAMARSAVRIIGSSPGSRVRLGPRMYTNA